MLSASQNKCIPRVIHYCWFGKDKIPDSNLQYMLSWRQKCPEFRILRWDESNFDYTKFDYTRIAYKLGLWAFVSDYARVKILYDYGGVYLDTDVELVKPLEPLISKGEGFIGFQNDAVVASGLGMSAPPQNECLYTMLNIYDGLKLTSRSEYYNYPCPIINTTAMKIYGMEVDKRNRERIQSISGMLVYPKEYFNPKNYNGNKMRVTDNTVSIHHYEASWKRSKLKYRIRPYIPSWALEQREILREKRAIKKIEQGLNKCH